MYALIQEQKQKKLSKNTKLNNHTTLTTMYK